MSGGYCTQQALVSKIIYGNCFHTDAECQFLEKINGGKLYRFVEYTPKKCFNKFVQSVVDARRQIDENPNSSVVVETMKLLANSSYGYHILDCSGHTVTKYLKVEKTHCAINSKFFEKTRSREPPIV